MSSSVLVLWALNLNWPEGNEWLMALSQCTNLRKLSLYDCQLIFSLPSLPMLRKLDIFKFDATQENIFRIASITKNLHEFEISTTEPIENGAIFKPLVNSNQNLKYFSMEDLKRFGD